MWGEIFTVYTVFLVMQCIQYCMKNNNLDVNFFSSSPLQIIFQNHHTVLPEFHLVMILPQSTSSVSLHHDFPSMSVSSSLPRVTDYTDCSDLGIAYGQTETTIAFPWWSFLAVDKSTLDPNLSQTKQDSHILRTVGHKQGHSVTMLNTQVQEEVSHFVGM